MAVVPQSDTGKCELTNLTKSCILHSLNILLKRNKPHREQLEKFCRELYAVASAPRVHTQYSGSKVKRSQSVPGAGDSLNLASLQINADEFEMGLLDLTAMDIFQKVERKLVKSIEGDEFNYDSLFRVCWKAYRVEKRPDSIVTEFSSQHPESDDCMYYLWLVWIKS